MIVRLYPRLGFRFVRVDVPTLTGVIVHKGRTYARTGVGMADAEWYREVTSYEVIKPAKSGRWTAAELKRFAEVELDAAARAYLGASYPRTREWRHLRRAALAFARTRRKGRP